MNRVIENIVVVVAVLIAIAIGFGIYAWSGAYNIGADAHHTRPVFALMTVVRDRSLNAHATDIKVPNLDDQKLILKGAGQYAAMCTQCHLRPGVENSEQREGMYPLPPNLSQVRFTPQREFWAIKHGIKMSGMPAWGVNHDDPTIWSMVAFLQKLPDMTPAQYKAIVAKAPPDEDMDMDMGDGGHSHSHGDDDHAAPASGMSAMPGMTMTPNSMQSISGSSQTSAMQAMLKPGAAPQAEAVAQAFQDALKDGDRAKALALLTPDAQISEGGETQSAKEYAAHHLGEDIAFLKDAKVKLISRASMLMSNTAMVGTESDIQAMIKGKSTTLRSRELLTLKKDGKDWKIVSIRWDSAPLPGE